jgi:hypothetical protein
VLSTYTGVLLGATAIPAWSASARVLPLEFGASALGSAVSILELLGHRDRALNTLGIGAALAETAIAARIDARADSIPGDERALMLTADVLSGPVPLLIRLLGGRSVPARRIAALSTIAGSILRRTAWIAAGRSSARSSVQAIATKSRRRDGDV